MSAFDSRIIRLTRAAIGSGPLTRVSSQITAGSLAVCEGVNTHTNVSPMR